MPTAKDLRAAYQVFADQAGSFDRDTTLQLRKRDEEQNKWLAGRKAEKAALMAKKLAASQAMNAAEEEEARKAKEAEAEKQRIAQQPPEEKPPQPAPAAPAKPRVVTTNTTSERKFENKDA